MEGFQDIEICYGIVLANSSRGALKTNMHSLVGFGIYYNNQSIWLKEINEMSQ